MPIYAPWKIQNTKYYFYYFLNILEENISVQRDAKLVELRIAEEL